MNLPKDPILLLSVVNTKLRDIYPNLEELAKAYLLEAAEIEAKLESIDYHYDKTQNQFI